MFLTRLVEAPPMEELLNEPAMIAAVDNLLDLVDRVIERVVQTNEGRGSQSTARMHIQTAYQPAQPHASA